MTRNPQRLDGYGVYGDFAEPDSLAAAAAGASALLLLAPSGPDLPARDRAMVRAAAGVPRIVKLSAIGTPDEPTDGLGAWHQPGERAVRSSGAEWTILRPTTFASNTLAWRAEIRDGRPIANMFGAGRQGVVDPADVAAVAVAALTGDGHAGRTYTLTGPELVSVPEQIRELGTVLGRPLTVTDLPLDCARARMLARGLTPAFVDIAIDGAALVRAGGNAIVTGDVPAVLGRPARTFAAWARDHRDAFG